MGNARHFVRTSVAVLGFAFAFAFGAGAQLPAAPKVKTAKQQFKNILVLKTLPANQLVPAMHLIEGDLGVTCGYCHVVDKWEKDDVPQKKTARKMMTMMLALNKNNFEGKQMVTCYTCHHGSPDPVSTLPLPPTSVTFPKYDPEWHPAKPNFPPADQIFDNYIQALGGEQALRKVTSRVITAARTIPAGPGGTSEVPARGQIYLKAPNLRLSVASTDKATIQDGFDGAVAWTQNARGEVNPLSPAEQPRAKRNANFYEPLELKGEYEKLEVRAVEKVNNRDAYVVVGTPAGESPETLYFDTQSGLLVKKITTLPNVVGASPYEVEYDDYRDTSSGVKFPFLIRSIPANPLSAVVSRTTIRVEKVDDNVPIDDSKFVKPQSKPAPPPTPPSAPAR
ncbi:MAG: photosynthetic reaction center cytochrome c subunit [Acidobacteriia bacterium]|nr:photosynthetic reaction center cytochrome c subunit [Terriglobia bacterium]